MYLTIEELKAMEEKYCEELRNAKARLDVVRDMIVFAENKEYPKSEGEGEAEQFQEETAE